LLTLSPLDKLTLIAVAKRFKRVLIVSESWGFCGISSQISEILLRNTKAEVEVMALKDCYPASSPYANMDYYPTSYSIAKRINPEIQITEPGIPKDIPDKSFTGPF